MQPNQDCEWSLSNFLQKIFFSILNNKRLQKIMLWPPTHGCQLTWEFGWDFFPFLLYIYESRTILFWFFFALFRTTFWEKSESKFGIFSRESFEESKNGENPPQKLSLLGIFAFVGLKWSPFFDSFSSRQIRLFKLSRQKLLVVMNNASSCSKTHIQDFLWTDSF